MTLFPLYSRPMSFRTDRHCGPNSPMATYPYYDAQGPLGHSQAQTTGSQCCVVAVHQQGNRDPSPDRAAVGMAIPTLAGPAT